MMPIKDIATALKLFENAAIAHSNAAEEGDYKTCNSSYAIIARSRAFIKNNNDEVLLKDFLHHENPGVRCWAASFLLSIFQNEAVETLKEIAAGKGIQSLNAEMTLSEWRKGNLK
jgi:hypothetical protein